MARAGGEGRLRGIGKGYRNTEECLQRDYITKGGSD